MAAEPKTATRTVMFTDIADYTASVARADREGLHQILAEHENRVRPLVEQYQGRIVKNIGDSFLCLFESATDALKAALDIQNREAGDGDEVQVRIGLTTGDIEMIDGDAFGDAVNLAARILAKAPVGEAWFGAATKACMNAAEIPWESVGWFRLKGIPGEQECFRVVPKHRVWLPSAVTNATAESTLVRIVAGAPIPAIPATPTIVFEGFEPGSAELASVLDDLPVLDPSSLFLVAYQIPHEPRQSWTECGRGLIVGQPQATNCALHALLHNSSERPSESSTDGSDTILLDKIERIDLELVICGIALPQVPLAEVVAGYTYDLLADGTWVTSSDEAILRIEVSRNRVVLHALSPEVSIAGAILGSGGPIELSSDTTIDTPAGQLRYLPTRSGYVGLVMNEGGRKLGVKNGQVAEIGRKPNPPGLAFPARDGQENIQWCSGARAARAKREDFSLDRVLAGRQQASIRPERDSIELHPMHDDCATFVLREGRIGRAKRPVRVRVGDMIVAGTNVIALRAPE
ncbi:MAG: adenylate/guanylate cyclase domain-containing protein [Gammaproteobacteria bacterium]|nr:adenylate/guanylate cyclase domain-containing protein [Gammaproteobacteria bacterium]